MDNESILKTLIEKLTAEGIWFTTKNDPTYGEAPDYYQLDEYGDLTDKAQQKICREIKSYIGNGAYDINEAIQLWLDDALMNFALGYEDTLVTKFKPREVVDGIKAYATPEDLLKEDVNISGAVTPMSDDLYKSLVLDKTENIWTDENWKDYYKSSYDSLKDIYDSSKSDIESIKKAKDWFNIRAKNVGLTDLTFSDDTIEKDFDQISKAYADKKEREFKEVNKLKVEENLKKLKEENTKSLNLISSMFTARDFDSDSPQGQIVIRTSELFNALSDKGYDVQVSFNNGQSQSNILLSRLGGQVIVTIMNATQPLRCFITGNMEITDDMLDTLKDIKDQVEAI